jgi:hypothetical protein
MNWTGTNMNWTKEDADDFLKDVLPPGKEKTGFGRDQGIRFVYALAIAIDEKLGGAPLLEALREKYPEASEAYMREAENINKNTAREPA